MAEDFKWMLNYTTTPMTDGPVQIKEGDSNNAGSFSSDLIGGSNRWPDGTYSPDSFSELPPPRRGLPLPLDELYALREKIFQDHVSYQQGFMHFLANDTQVPEELQARVNRFGLDPQEFRETGNWPHQLYVRDSHFCQRVPVEIDGITTVRNEGGFSHNCPIPYAISYRSIVPKKAECKNLLVPVCLSSSHVAYGSIRMEPVFMILGQSAGTAAALAIDNRTAVQDLPYDTLRKQLKADDQILGLR